MGWISILKTFKKLICAALIVCLRNHDALLDRPFLRWTIGYLGRVSYGIYLLNAFVIETLGRAPGRHTLAEVAEAADLNRATAPTTEADPATMTFSAAVIRPKIGRSTASEYFM